MSVLCKLGLHRWSEYTMTIEGAGFTSVRETCDRCEGDRRQWIEPWKADAL